MKKKHICLVIFLALIFGLGAFNTYAAPNLINKDLIDSEVVETKTKFGIQNFGYFFAKAIVENEGASTFVKDSDQLTQKERDGLNVWNSNSYRNDSLFSDPNFRFKIVNEQTGKIVAESKTAPTKEGSRVYIEHKVDGNDMDVYPTILSQAKQAIGLFSGKNLSVKMQDNYLITYSIPQELVMSQQSRVNSYLFGSEIESYALFATGLAIATGIIVCLFIIFAPYKYIEELQPFKAIKRWKFEISAIVFTVLVSVGGLASVFYFAYLHTGYAEEVLQELMSIPALHTILMIGSVFLWALLYLFVACLMFAIKRFFTNGFVKTLKEDTIVGWIVNAVGRAIHRVTTLDLDNKSTKKLLVVLAINFIVISICSVMFGIGIFFGLIYTIAVFIFLDKKLRKIELDHSVIQNELQVLAKGDFSMEFNTDIGVFNHLQDELKNVRTGFEMAVKEEMKSQSMKTELITNVSHDLKTPVTCIKNYVELLNNEDVSIEERIDYLKNIEHYTNRLEHLIEDLFDVSKASSGNITLNVEEIPITELIDQVLIELQEQIDSRHLTVVTNYNINEGLLNLDGSKTYRIFENLLTNICKYSLESTRVYIDVDEGPNMIQVTLKNISKTQLDFDVETIKERFNRADSSRHENGSGLGLAIVESFTELQNGHFDIEVDGDLFKAILIFNK